MPFAHQILALDESTLDAVNRWLKELRELQGTSLLQVIKEVGVAIKLIRPSTRIRRSVPSIDWQEMTPPPVDLLWMRAPRYAHKTNDTPSHKRSRTKKEPGVI